MNEKIGYWHEMATYDLDTARAMLRTDRLLYVGFMCHQCIEKSLKALYISKFPDEQPPYIHKLMKLCKMALIYGELSFEQKNLINTLDPLNIEARYPSDKDAIFASLTREKCKSILYETEELYTWIGSRL